MRQLIRWGIVRTHHLPVLGTLYRKGCQLGAWVVGRQLARMPGVESVFVAHSHPSSVTFVAGHSDLDLTLVFDDEVAEVPLRIRECAAAIEKLSRLFFFVWPRDARFISRGELTRYLTLFWSPEILYEPADWILLAGKESRNGRSCFSLPHRIPWHPEFNKWWGNVLQSDIFAPRNTTDTRFMRGFYRIALKSQLHLNAARGISVERPAGYIEDELPMGQFVGDPELSNLLADLKERCFWERRPDYLKARILLAILVNVGDFYSDWKAHPEISRETPIHASAIEEPNRSIYGELKHRIQGCPELTSILEAAVVYPSPHWYPYEYQVDLILREGLPVEDFVKAVSAIKRGFGGRTFAIGTTHVQFTIALKSIYQHPLYFLGSPFPFLREHIRQFGALIYGSPTEAIQGTLSRADLLEWCRICLPFHMYNFRRRPEYFAKDVNFYQLASLRLFLETGEVLTDAPQIRQAYLDRFVNKDQERAVLDYYLQRPGIPASAELYADAFAFVASQYERVESLLMGSDAGSRVYHP